MSIQGARPPTGVLGNILDSMKRILPFLFAWAILVCPAFAVETRSLLLPSDPLDETLIGLREWASDFDGIEFRKEGTNIVASGTIDNPRDWSNFLKILALKEFHGKVKNKVSFQDVRREPVHVNVGLVFVRTDRLRDAADRKTKELQKFLEGERSPQGADSMKLEGSVTNILAEWSAAGVIAGMTVCSMTVRSDGFETTHRMDKWTLPAKSANEGPGNASEQVFEYGIGLENRNTRRLDERNVEIGFSLRIAGKPEVKTAKSGAVFIKQPQEFHDPTFRDETGRTTIISCLHDENGFLSLFRKEGWLQYDSGYEADSKGGPENLLFLIIAGTERSEAL